MTSSAARRAVLSVPAGEPAKVLKALNSLADEVVVDLEDAVALDAKVGARTTIGDLAPRERGSIAVRVNGVDTAWHHDDLLACAANPADRKSVV